MLYLISKLLLALMKLIVGVAASDDVMYNQFKNIWIENIKNIPDHLKDQIQFYFLYSDNHKVMRSLETHTDFYCNKTYDNISESIFNRTISFYKYLRKEYSLDNDSNYLRMRNSGTYILRTNVSTLFDFSKLIKWLQNKPKTLFLGGSINGSYVDIYTTMSGTNMVFSLDLVLYLTENNKIDLNVYSEDEALSVLIIQNLNVFLINIKRLDFIQIHEIPDLQVPYVPHSVIFHKCKIGDESLFCFRFKSFDRSRDLQIMKYVNDSIYKKDICSIVQDTLIKYNLGLATESPSYSSLFSESTFKIHTGYFM